MLNRAYSRLDIKSVDSEKRIISGTATTPTPDRMDDVIEPLGVKFKNPLPLLLYHDSQRPVGIVRFAKPTEDGIEFEASIPEITEPGTLKDRVDEAWQSVKARLIRGVSIGFRSLDDGVELLRTGGLRFLKTEVLELSLVAIPANQDAVISTIKAIDTRDLALSGAGHVGVVSKSSPGGAHVVRLEPQRSSNPMKTIREQASAFEATRQAKSARMTEIMSKAGDEGVTLDQAQSEEYDTLETETKAIDAHLRRLDVLEKANIAAARPVAGATHVDASASRGGSVITVKDNLPPGIEFARAVMCKMASYLDHVNAVEIAKERYPDNPRIQHFLRTKGAVPAGTTTQTDWASSLVYAQNLASEFLAYLRPMTIIGKFGQGGIPSLRRVPFNVRVNGQTSGGTGYWVGQGKAKPLTSFAFAATTMLFTKVASIAVISQELARFSSPSAETLVRDALTGALVERIDTDLIDPTSSAVAGVNPASLTSGLTPLTSAGVTADFARTDLGHLLAAFVVANVDPSSLVLIMPNTLALGLSLMVNSLGQREFPGLTMRGGELMGIPVIASQYAANPSGAGNMVIAVNASDIFLADDDQVTVDVSTEASLEMSDAPASNSGTPTGASMTSMFQTNSMALRAERYIGWAKARSTAVVYMDDVNWNSVGSPS